MEDTYFTVRWEEDWVHRNFKGVKQFRNMDGSEVAEMPRLHQKLRVFYQEDKDYFTAEVLALGSRPGVLTAKEKKGYSPEEVAKIKKVCQKRKRKERWIMKMKRCITLFLKNRNRGQIRQSPKKMQHSKRWQKMLTWKMTPSRPSPWSVISALKTNSRTGWLPLKMPSRSCLSGKSEFFVFSLFLLLSFSFSFFLLWSSPFRMISLESSRRSIIFETPRGLTRIQSWSSFLEFESEVDFHKI